MDCQDCNHLLALYMDESLTVQERAEIKRHLSECANCRKELELLNRTVEMVSQLPGVDAPFGFENRVMARLNAGSGNEKSWFFWRTFSLSTVAAAAMVLVTLVVYRPIQTRLEMPSAPAPGNSIVAESAKAASAPAAAVAGKPAKAERVDALPEEPARTAGALQAQAPAANNRREERAKAAEAENAAEDVADYGQVPASSMYRPVSSAPVYPVALQERMAGGGEAAPAARSMAMKKAMADAPTLYREKREWSGEICQVETPANKVVRNAGELAAVWRQARITSIQAPALDWRQDMLGIIFLGKRPGTGYEIQVRAVETLADRVAVRYHVENRPGPGSRFSQPFLAFVIPATTLPVVFTEE